jgi:hypothetical protein
MVKILGPFDILKVIESKKTCKTSKSASQCLKPNERGLRKKSIESMENMPRSNYQITKNMT